MKATETHKKVSKILAQTDWKAFWEEVAKAAEPEIKAYDEARRKSLARAYKKILR